MNKENSGFAPHRLWDDRRFLIPRPVRVALAIGVWTVLSLGLLFSHAAHAEDEVAVAKTQLKEERTLLAQISNYADRLDLARLQLLIKDIEAVELSIEKNGLSNFKTLSLYQELIVTFRYSFSFFHQIETPHTKASIAEILRINDAIVHARGFDDSPYTQITSHVFSHMHRLFLQLTYGPLLEPQLRAKLPALIVPIARVIAIANEGDRPRTFEAAVPLYWQIADLYPDFDKIVSSHAAFDIVLEIQSLNEFYAEFAQIDTKAGRPRK